MIPARARARITRSGVERTNHEAIAPLRVENRRKKNNCFSAGFLADFSVYYLVHNLLS